MVQWRYGENHWTCCSYTIQSCHTRWTNEIRMWWGIQAAWVVFHLVTLHPYEIKQPFLIPDAHSLFQKPHGNWRRWLLGWYCVVWGRRERRSDSLNSGRLLNFETPMCRVFTSMHCPPSCSETEAGTMDWPPSVCHICCLRHPDRVWALREEASPLPVSHTWTLMLHSVQL